MPGGAVVTHPATGHSLACHYVCDISRVCFGGKANDERGRRALMVMTILALARL